jgi:hypothetical protein
MSYSPPWTYGSGRGYRKPGALSREEEFRLAFKNGLLKRQPCVVCGQPKVTRSSS